jgi:uncharacterized protein YndB with AHSA1/START domain
MSWGYPGNRPSQHNQPSRKGTALMRTITSSIVIERPIDEVFTFVTDARNNLLWQSNSGLTAIQQQPDGPVGVGTRIVETREILGHASENRSEVTGYEPNRRYVRSQIAGSGPIARGEFTFEPVPGGTRWVIVLDFQADDPIEAGEASLAAGLRQSIETDMAVAKALLERRVVENAR